MRPGTNAALSVLPTAAQRRAGLDLSGVRDHGRAWIGQRCHSLDRRRAGTIAALRNINPAGHARQVIVTWDDGAAGDHLLAELWRDPACPR